MQLFYMAKELGEKTKNNILLNQKNAFFIHYTHDKVRCINWMCSFIVFYCEIIDDKHTVNTKKEAKRRWKKIEKFLILIY